MSISVIDHFIYQTRVATHVTNKDALKRLMAAMMISLISWQIDDPRAVYIMVGAIVTSEIISRLVNKSIALTGPPLPLWRCIFIWVVNWLGVFPLLAPPILLASNGSDALLVVGLLWLFGLYTHITTSYAALPFYNWTLILPTFLVSFLLFTQAYAAPNLPSSPFQWYCASAMLVVYIANTFETMSSQKSVLTQLAIARKDAEKRLTELEFLTRHDHLTGLMNRRALEEATISLLRSRRSWERGTLGYFLIDLDHFKPINDSYSHKAGDLVLKTVADRLRRLVGNSGLVARLGGDEFAIVLPGLRNEAQALLLGNEMIAKVNAPIMLDQRSLTVGASVGIALTQTAQDSLAGLSSGADQAMYAAKADLRDKAHIYDRDSFPARASLDDRITIQKAMDDNSIGPFYQPKVNLDTGVIEGFEALCRWQHPTRGLLLPGRFLPHIDELGLQSEFLMHMTGRVLIQIDAWLDEGFDPGEVSVNLPEVTLATQGAREEVLSLISNHPKARKFLTFEVTEDVFIARSGSLIQESIAAFRREGVRISLDDFGTGFASFKHLRELEFDELKLDTEFVRGLGHDRAAEVLVRGFLQIGKGLDVKVIAEGVETELQRSLLRQMGCQVAQGFYYSPAIPFDEARAALFRQHRLGVPFSKQKVISGAA